MNEEKSIMYLCIGIAILAIGVFGGIGLYNYFSNNSVVSYNGYFPEQHRLIFNVETYQDCQDICFKDMVQYSHNTYCFYKPETNVCDLVI